MIVAVFAVGVVTNWRPSTFALASILGWCVLVVAVTAIAVFTRGDQRRRTLTTSLVVALLAIELFSYENHARVKRFDYEDDPPAYLTFLQENVGEDRVLSAGRDGLYAEWGSALGIRQIETLNVMQIPEYRPFFFRYLNRAESGRFLEIGADTAIEFDADASALDQMEVRYIIVADELEKYGEAVAASYPLVFDDREAGIRVFENTDAFPRAYLSPALVHRLRPRLKRRRGSRTAPFTTDAAVRGRGESGRRERASRRRCRGRRDDRQRSQHQRHRRSRRDAAVGARARRHVSPELVGHGER